MANQTSLRAHGSIIQARRRHRPLLPFPTMSQCQGRGPGETLKPETDNQARPKKWPPDRVQKKTGPRTEPRKRSRFFKKGVKPDSWASPLADKSGAQKPVIKKWRCSKTNTGQQKQSSDQRLLRQAVSAEKQAALSTRETF